MSEKKDFINDEEIFRLLEEGKNPEKAEIREIFAKSKDMVRLEPAETAKLLQIKMKIYSRKCFHLQGK
jgi:2-iminoacetate synthase